MTRGGLFARLSKASLVCPELLPVSADKWERRVIPVARRGVRWEEACYKCPQGRKARPGFLVRLPEASLSCPELSPLNPFLLFGQASEQAGILRSKPCVIVDWGGWCDGMSSGAARSSFPAGVQNSCLCVLTRREAFEQCGTPSSKVGVGLL